MKPIENLINFIKYRNIKVSIILPIYNAEKYLNKCLDSILKQNIERIEIITVNDCSSDNSLNILNRYRAKHRSIKIINNINNSGAGYARNIAIKKAKGKYITFIDSDDWFSEYYLYQLYNEAERTNADIVFSNMKYVEQDHERENQDYYNLMEKYQSSLEPITELATDWPYTAPWMKLYRREFIDQNKLKFMEGIRLGAEDISFTWISYLLANKISFCENANYYYNIIPESLDRSINENIFEIIDALEFTASEYFRVDPEGIRRPQLDAMRVSHLLYQFTKITSSNSEKNKNLASEYWKKAHDLLKKVNPVNINDYNYVPWRKKSFFNDVINHQTFNTKMYNKYMIDKNV